MKNILCFGDSNTWGFDPSTGGRYPREVRWTGRLQAALPDCRILEEGLNGRTTVFEDDLRPGRRGLTYLPIALKTHDPLDLVIFMLGSNDCKNRLRLSAAEIAEGVQLLIEQTRNPSLHLRQQPAILVVAPPPFEPGALARGGMRFTFGAESVETSRLLARFFRAAANQMGAHFFDAGQVTLAEADGVHLSAAGHAALADALTGFLPHIL